MTLTGFLSAAPGLYDNGPYQGFEKTEPGFAFSFFEQDIKNEKGKFGKRIWQK